MKKNIILQHYEPQSDNIGKPTPEIVQKSSVNIKRYAESLGAEYKLLDGYPFQEGLRSQCQKCCAINEEYDKYDTVVVLDTDKFVTTTCTDNVFEAKGIAVYDDVHRNRQQPAFMQEFPRISSPEYPMWSGAIYVMPRDFRQLMRKQINDAMRKVFKLISPRPYVDEGIFHVLCFKAQFKLDTYLDEKWDYSSYLPNPESANMIHIRHRPKTHIENYYDLVNAGIIAE
jgi:hypothetical protein